MSLSKKALEARGYSKFFGGAALKGTAKQKEWAEKIRADKLRSMTPEQAIFACDPNGLLAHSKFWIENRDKSGQEIGSFVEKQKALLALYQSYKERGDADACAKIASEYNSLTELWGWKE